jgi:predicted acylesterase/phospholipase RssA
VLDIAGGGMWFFWQAGVCSFLQRHHDLGAVPLHGSSSGAIVAALAASGVDLRRAARRAAEAFAEQRLHER